MSCKSSVRGKEHVDLNVMVSQSQGLVPPAASLAAPSAQGTSEKVKRFLDLMSYDLPLAYEGLNETSNMLFSNGLVCDIRAFSSGSSCRCHILYLIAMSAGAAVPRVDSCGKEGSRYTHYACTSLCYDERRVGRPNRRERLLAIN